MPSGAPETRHLRDKDVTGFDHQLTTRHEAVFGLGARILGCCPILLCGRGRQNRRLTVISFSPPRMTDFFANHASRLSWKTEEDEWDRRGGSIRPAGVRARVWRVWPALSNAKEFADTKSLQLGAARS